VIRTLALLAPVLLVAAAAACGGPRTVVVRVFEPGLDSAPATDAS
jgi:hypothetical protein